MKIKLLLAFILILTLNLNAQDSTSVILKKAFEQAEKQNKNVFVIFHASWCGWCKKMDKNMDDESCKELFNRNYIIEHLDVNESPNNKNLENPGALELLKKYKAENSGIPFFLIFDKKGKLLEDSFNSKGENLGCPASKEEVEEFIRMLKATSDLNEKELDVIYQKFLIKK
jgi:thioredoxin-related protein